MNYPECRKRFIETWGRLGPQWGINRTMAQIHALLMVSPDALTADHIVQELEISKANAHMNLKCLVEWGLVSKECREGGRCEFYAAEKNIHRIFKQILIQRKKRELDPILTELDALVSCSDRCNESKEFRKMVLELRDFTQKADRALELLKKTDAHWFYNTLMKML